MQIVIDMPKHYFDNNIKRELPIYLTEEQIVCILPKGHGRLIDADAIPEQIELKGFLSQDNAHLVTIDRVKEALDNAPTIIEADKEVQNAIRTIDRSI